MEQKPLIIAPRFRPLFNAIFYRDRPRVNVIAPTQDGKSLTIASAVTIVASSEPERFTIVAPSEKKADIIMSEIREFATQNPIIASQLELDKGDTLDRLRRERSKKHITFKRGGGIQTLSLDARNGKRNFESAMGFGSKNILADEAGLIEDPLWATVMRMLGGDLKFDIRRKMIIKIGNPFFRNHFYRSSKDPDYFQVLHNYLDSMRDYENGYYGYTPAYIEEMRKQAFFDVFYECKFPDEDMIDAKGYRQLVRYEDIKQGTVTPIGIARLGADIGGGGDSNVYIIRWDNCAIVVGTNRSKDTMTNVTEIIRLMEEFKIEAEDVSIDDIGIGRGVTDRLRELDYAVNGVSVGSPAIQKGKYANLKAELSWDCALWLKAGNVLEPNTNWQQATWIKYKVNTDKVIKIEPKQEMKTRTGKSPDYWDALVLTFFEPPQLGVMQL